MAAWLTSLALTLVLVGLESGDHWLASLRSLWDIEAANVGDPFPTVRAATALAADPRALLYRGFRPLGSSFIYPPFAALVYLPLAGRDHADLPLVLCWISRALWLGSVVLAAALARSPRLPPWVAVAFGALGALLFYPLLRALELNQASLIVGVAVGGALLAARGGRGWLAGILIGAAAAFKPQLGVILVLSWWHDRRVTLGGLGFLGASLALAVGITGLQNHIDYVRLVLPPLSAGYAFFPNQSLHGAVLRLAGAEYYGFALATPAAGVRVLVLVLAALTLLAVAWSVRRDARRGGDRARRLPLVLGLAWICATFVSPVSWEHHYIPALFVLALLLRDSLEGTLSRSALVLATLSVPLVSTYFDVPAFHGDAMRLASSSMLIGLLLLGAAVIVRANGFLGGRREEVVSQRAKALTTSSSTPEPASPAIASQRFARECSEPAA